MIKFFRKIREKMLNESKPASPVGRFSKYLIYAIGEIILVVIGILIALQINNWNENNINRGKEIVHLENILNNLNDDLYDEIIPCIEATEKQILAYGKLKIGFYEENNLTNDSIRSLVIQNLRQWDLVLNTVAFDNLKSSGMDILSSDSIKSNLLTLYGNSYKYIESLQNKNNKFHNDGVTTLMHDNVNLWDTLSDEDKEFLKNDKRISSRLRTEAYMYNNFLNELKYVKPKTEDLIGAITQEIKRLEDM